MCRTKQPRSPYLLRNPLFTSLSVYELVLRSIPDVALILIEGLLPTAIVWDDSPFHVVNFQSASGRPELEVLQMTFSEMYDP